MNIFEFSGFYFYEIEDAAWGFIDSEKELVFSPNGRVMLQDSVLSFDFIVNSDTIKTARIQYVKDLYFLLTHQNSEVRFVVKKIINTLAGETEIRTSKIIFKGKPYLLLSNGIYFYKVNQLSCLEKKMIN